MKHIFPRRPWRRHRRPQPPQPTRAQITQSLRRLRILCYLEWDLATVTGNVPRRMAVVAEAASLDQALKQLEATDE